MKNSVESIKKLVHAAQSSFLVLYRMSHENMKTFLYIAKWPDLTDSIVEYIEDSSDDKFRSIMADAVPIIIGPLKIVAKAYCEILEKHNVDKKSDLENVVKAADDVKDILPLESKRLLIRFIDEELVPELLNRGVNAIGVSDE